MRRPLPASRTRRIAKWSGLVVCVVILALWAVSTVAVLHFLRGPVGGGLQPGLIWANWRPKRTFSDRGWFLERRDFHPGIRRKRILIHKGDFVAVHMPFWIPLTLAAIPTAILWRRDRRTVKPGYCVKCGYDLRASKKVCPECGVGIVSSKTVGESCLTTPRRGVS